MRFSLVSITFFIFVFMISNAFFIKASCPHALPERFAHIKPGNVVAAYFASWDKYGSYRLDQYIDSIAPHLTHIMYAFAKPDAQTGLCTLYDAWADVGANFQHRKKVGGHFGQLLALKKKYPHLKIILSIGGGKHSKTLSELGQTADWTEFVESVDALLDGYVYTYEHSDTADNKDHYFDYADLFDGIDLDWEWQDSVTAQKDAAAYISLLQELRVMLQRKSTLKQRPFILTAAVQVRTAILQAINISHVASMVDWLHVMAYDYASSSNGSSVSLNAPICNAWSGYSIDSTLQNLYEMNVSPDKIVLGIALYGHAFDQVPEKIGVAFEKTERTKTYRYESIEQMLEQDGNCKKKWHKLGRVPYVYCAGTDKNDGLFITYDDAQSVALKCDFAKSQSLKGVAFWRLSGDDKKHTLMSVVAKY